MTWSEIIAIGALLVGAVGAFYKFWYLKRIVGKVRMFYEKDKSMSGFSDLLGFWVLVLIFENHSPEKTIKLSSYGFYIQETKEFYHPESIERMPDEVVADDSCRLSFKDHDFSIGILEKDLSGKIHIIGYYVDKLNKYYESAPLEYDTGIGKRAE